MVRQREKLVAQFPFHNDRARKEEPPVVHRVQYPVSAKKRRRAIVNRVQYRWRKYGRGSKKDSCRAGAE